MRQSVNEATERAAAEMRKVRKESNNALRLQQQQAKDELKISHKEATKAAKEAKGRVEKVSAENEKLKSILAECEEFYHDCISQMSQQATESTKQLKLPQQEASKWERLAHKYRNSGVSALKELHAFRAKKQRAIIVWQWDQSQLHTTAQFLTGRMNADSVYEN